MHGDTLFRKLPLTLTKCKIFCAAGLVQHLAGLRADAILKRFLGVLLRSFGPVRDFALFFVDADIVRYLVSFLFRTTTVYVEKCVADVLRAAQQNDF